MFWNKATLIVGGPIILLLLLLLGDRRNLFLLHGWYDSMMHLLGGAFFVISLAGVLWHLIYKKTEGRMPRPVLFKSGILLALLLTTIAWEVFEVSVGLEPNWTQSVSDTLFDIADALLGAVIVLPFVRIHKKTR